MSATTTELAPVRFSRLKLMQLSPAHYRDATVEETSAMERGTAVHSILLGGAPVMYYPGPVRRGKEWDAFEAANAHAQILTRSDYDTAHRMADAVRANDLAMSVLKGQHEVEIAWKMLGRACGSRVDVVGADYVTELKTCRSADPRAFQWQALRMHYHAQLSFYQDAVRHGGGKALDAYIVAVESAPPHVVTVLQLTERALEQGRRSVRLWFERVLQCEQAGEWPGYCQSVVPLDAPEDEEELIFGDEAA